MVHLSVQTQTRWKFIIILLKILNQNFIRWPLNFLFVWYVDHVTCDLKERKNLFTITVCSPTKLSSLCKNEEIWTDVRSSCLPFPPIYICWGGWEKPFTESWISIDKLSSTLPSRRLGIIYIPCSCHYH